MRFLHQTHLRISTLAPVHIGCTDDYSPTNYVIEENALFAFDHVAAADALAAPVREQLLKIVSGRISDSLLLKIQSFIYQQREALMAASHHFLPVAAGIAQLYRERIQQAAQTESSGRSVMNKLTIERTFYNPANQQPLLPGSSLKGAIRTALLDSVNQGRELQKVEDHKTHKPRNENNQELQQRLLSYRMGSLEKDPMRLVQIADAAWSGGEDVACSEIRFAVDRPKRENKDDPAKRTMAEDKGLYQMLETIPGWRFRAFQSELILLKPDGIQQQQKLPTPDLRWSLSDIVRACNAFYRPLLERELKMLNERSYTHPDWHRLMQNLLGGELGQTLDAGKAFLLRVGRHSGAEAVTLNGVRSIKIMLGRDPETGKQRSTNEPQARTVWLAAEHQDARSEMQPFGWLLVEVDEQSRLPGMGTLMTSANVKAHTWIEQQQAKLQTLRNAQTERLTKERQQEQERQRQVQEEAERQKKLAELSSEQRTIMELRSWLDADKAAGRKEPNGRLPNRLSALLKDCAAWPLDAKSELADLAEAIYGYLGWGKDAKAKQERRARIQALRNG